jgi:hypothetical protein
VTEVRLGHPGGDDEAVIGDLEVAQVGSHRGVDDAAVEVEAGDLGELDPDVLVAPHHVPDRRGDLPR